MNKQKLVLIVSCLTVGILIGFSLDYLSMQNRLDVAWDTPTGAESNMTNSPYGLMGMTEMEFNDGINSLGINSSEKFKEYYISQVIPLMKDDLFSSIQLEDLIGTNETKQEWVNHFCNSNSTGDYYEFHSEFCNSMKENGAGYLGFNQTGGFSDATYAPFDSQK